MATETPAVSTPTSGIATVQFDDFNVTSNSETTEQLTQQRDSERAEEVSKAAKQLGEKGGKASAEARAAKPIKPIPDKPKVEAKVSDDGEAKEEAGEVEEKPLGKPRDDPKARMLEATRQAAELKRALAQKERELAEARAARAEAKPEPKTETKGQTYKDDPTIKPIAANYTDWEEYNEDLVDWKTDRKLEATIQKAQEQRARQAAMAEQESYHEQVNKAFENYSTKVQNAWVSKEAFEAEVNPDLISWETSVEVRNRGGRVGPENCVADEIVSMDDPVPTMRYLSQHPDELQRLATLTSPRLIAREMAKIEDRANAATTATAPRTEVSRAPKPVRPVTGGPHAATDDMSDDLDFDAHVARMNAKERKSARR